VSVAQQMIGVKALRRQVTGWGKSTLLTPLPGEAIMGVAEVTIVA
jgi:hypothetical protein